MRGLGSKLLAGGLSAGVILLWWPSIFPTDTPVSWLVRGVVWTLMFEVLLLATMPFELALWDTRKGSRLVDRVNGARERFSPEDPRRRLNVRGGIAVCALALPLVLLGTGAQKHLWERAAHKQPVEHVTRVVKVVEPVQVRRVVEHEIVTVPGAPAAPTPVSSRPQPRRARPQRHEGSSAPVRISPERSAPVAGTTPPSAEQPGTTTQPDGGSAEAPAVAPGG